MPVGGLKRVGRMELGLNLGWERGRGRGRVDVGGATV